MSAIKNLGLAMFVLLLFWTASPPVGAADTTIMTKQDDRIVFEPSVEHNGLVLTVTGPGDAVFRNEFKAREVATFLTTDSSGKPLPDGVYRFELQVKPVIDDEVRKALATARESGDTEIIDRLRSAGKLPTHSLTHTGSFSIQKGSFVKEVMSEQTNKDILHYDDVIITGSLCVGFDCADGEAFGFDTIILKEHNLRIYFNDTSYTASYPTNAWRITINDSTNGGASYFSIDDVDDGTSIFRVEAGAPSHSLYVEDYGRVGFGTSTPVVELHVKDSDTPTMRLEQDSSGGWTAQTWDLAGNESNFFVRDATNGSKLPFRIQPNTPSSTLCLKSDGYVGIGTWSPSTILDIEANEPVVISLNNTTAADWRFNSANNSTFRVSDDGDAEVEFSLQDDGDLTITGSLTTAGGSYPDYVFDPDYALMPLDELATFIAENRHLPNVPTSEQVDGGKKINMTELQIRLLEKVEELTLYTLSQQEAIAEVEGLKRLTTAQSEIIEQLQARLAALEEEITE